ncbi:MAG TPA: FtsX-like permease family protein [Caulobacteraceae bacterium]|jgi:putative ABC transport system permease protein|nr:FtsX-like permease family protein [Caulobacteraceae bacterium]
MSLALSTLIYEWRRYMAAVVALAFAGLLVLSVTGLFMGIGESFNAPIERSPADIMVLGPTADALFGGGAGLPARIGPQMYMYPGVAQVEDLELNFAIWQNDPNGGAAGKKPKKVSSQQNGLTTYAIDNTPGSVTTPIDFGQDLRTALDEPYAIALDETALNQLGVKLGDKASLNGTSVTVRYVVHGYANVINPMVFMSRQTALLIGVAHQSNRTGPLMVKLYDPSQAATMRDKMNANANGQYRAWTRGDLAKANQKSLLNNNVIGIMLFGGLALGGLVGLVITWQTLRGAIFANIKEFASLRALGVPMGALRWVIMELAFWVGVAGLAFTAVMVWGLTVVAAAFGLPMAYPIEWVVAVVVMLMVVAIGSGFLSLGVLKKSQPADLLR